MLWKLPVRWVTATATSTLCYSNGMERSWVVLDDPVWHAIMSFKLRCEFPVRLSRKLLTRYHQLVSHTCDWLSIPPRAWTACVQTHTHKKKKWEKENTNQQNINFVQMYAKKVMIIIIPHRMITNSIYTIFV